MKWTPSYNLIAQLSHFAWGALFVMVFQALDGAPWWGLLLLLLWTAPKEFVFDIWIEGASWPDSAVDFAFYWVGAAAALLLIYGQTLGGCGCRFGCGC